MFLNSSNAHFSFEKKNKIEQLSFKTQSHYVNVITCHFVTVLNKTNDTKPYGNSQDSDGVQKVTLKKSSMMEIGICRKHTVFRIHT